MSDSAVGPFPQVFVVDSQASCVSVPTAKKAKCSGMGQKILFMLMGIAMLGLALQAYLIFNLYNKVEVKYLMVVHTVPVGVCVHACTLVSVCWEHGNPFPLEFPFLFSTSHREKKLNLSIS